MNPLIPLAAIAGAALYGTSGRRAKASDPNVTAGKLQFYRGGKGALRPGPAYFSSAKWLAEFYGPVKEHRLYLRNPKFVSENEWGDFDSNMLRFDPSPVNRLRAQGYDSAVWVKGTPQGTMYNVYALAGTDAIKKPKGGTSSIQAAFDAALHDADDAAEELKLLRRVAKRLKIDVTGLTVYQGDDYTEVYDRRGRVWVGRRTTATDAKSRYIAELIRQKIDVLDVRAAYEEAEWGSYDEDERLELFRKIAERLDIDVSRLTTYQAPGDYTEVYDGGIRVWFDRPTPDFEALQEYIKLLIRQKIDVR